MSAPDFNKFFCTLLQISPIYYGARDLVENKWIWRSSVTEDGDALTGHPIEVLETIEQDEDLELEMLVHEDDLPQFKQNVVKVKTCETDEPIESVFRLKKADHSIAWLRSIHKVYERDTNNVPTKAAVIVEDISGGIELQDQLEDFVSRLEAISFKNSHEVRAPVASILGLVDLLRRQGSLLGYDKVLIEHLYKSVKKLDNIISDITGLT